MFDWLGDLFSGIGDAIGGTIEYLGTEIANTIFDSILQWFYEIIYGAVADFFSMMGNMGADIFDLSWVQATIKLFTLFGWSLFVAGTVVAIFDVAIEYQNGRANIKTTSLNILKGFFACSLIGVVPVELYKFCISLQNTFSHDLTGIVSGAQSLDLAGQSTTVLEGSFRVSADVTFGLLNLLCLIAFAYCVIKVFFQNIKRGGILLVQMTVGSLYMFSVPRGYTDGFNQWIKQVAAICLTAFMQTTLLFLGLLTFPDHMLMGLGIMLAPSNKKGKNQFQQLMELLPNDHKAKWFAGAALNTAEQSMASVMSTALSRLNSFLDSELEQLLCFDTEIDAESFCNEKSAIFIIMPEENPNTFFMISLIIQQLYREILAVADENGGKLKNRCVFYCDEFGTLPKIESAEMMFSAARSRRLQIVPIIQSFSQLDKNYGKEGSEIIVDNTQITLFGGFAPNSSSAETLSKALGSRTVMTGSVSRSKNDPSQSLQMIERPLLTPDELKSLPKGDFVVMKTGVHPMRVHLKLFFKWGIEFDEKHPYSVAEHGNRKVEYAEKKEIQDGIMKKYHPQEYAELQEADKAAASGGQDQAETQRHEPQKTPPQGDSSKNKSKSGGGGLKPERRDRSIREAVSEVKSDGQA